MNVRQLWNTAVRAAKLQSPGHRTSPSSWRALPSKSLVSHLLPPQRAPSPCKGLADTCGHTTPPCSCYTP